MARDVLPSIHGDRQMHISWTISDFVLLNGPLALVLVKSSSPSINLLISSNRVSSFSNCEVYTGRFIV